MARFRALPYAKALFEVVRDQEPERAEAIADELDRAAAAIEAVPDLLRVLVAPTVPSEVKAVILDQVIEVLAVGQLTRRFLLVVQEHYRMEHVPDIAAAYRERVDRSVGRTRARVETAEVLDEAQRRRLTEVVAAIEGGTVAAEFATRPELLGGFRLQVGSRVFDGSLAGELDRLSRQIEIEQGQQG
jgi:F-type H+-transporting ATPase subunit delta